MFVGLPLGRVAYCFGVCLCAVLLCGPAFLHCSSWEAEDDGSSAWDPASQDPIQFLVPSPGLAPAGIRRVNHPAEAPSVSPFHINILSKMKTASETFGAPLNE